MSIKTRRHFNIPKNRPSDDSSFRKKGFNLHISHQKFINYLPYTGHRSFEGLPLVGLEPPFCGNLRDFLEWLYRSVAFYKGLWGIPVPLPVWVSGTKTLEIFRGLWGGGLNPLLSIILSIKKSFSVYSKPKEKVCD